MYVSTSVRINFSMFRLVPMDGPGTVTWEEFLENAERLLVVSDKISDGWKLYGDKVHRVPSSHLYARITCKSNGRIKHAN